MHLVLFEIFYKFVIKESLVINKWERIAGISRYAIISQNFTNRETNYCSKSHAFKDVFLQMCEYVECLWSLEKISQKIKKDTIKKILSFWSWKEYSLSIRNVLDYQAGYLAIAFFPGILNYQNDKYIHSYRRRQIILSKHKHTLK